MQSRGRNLFTDPVAPVGSMRLDVDVEMVFVSRGRTGAQHRREPAAGGGAHSLKSGLRRGLAARAERQDSPARQLETRDVEREPDRMRAQLSGCFTVAVAAFKARSRSDRLQGGAEVFSEDGGDHPADPQGQTFGQTAIDQGPCGELDGAAGAVADHQTLKPDWHRDGASLTIGRRRLGPEFDAQISQPSKTCPDVGRAGLVALAGAGRLR